MRFAGGFWGRGDALPVDKNYEIAAKLAENESMFWAEVHKEILQISSAPLEVKEKSREWLIMNGYSTGRHTA